MVPVMVTDDAHSTVTSHHQRKVSGRVVHAIKEPGRKGEVRNPGFNGELVHNLSLSHRKS